MHASRMVLAGAGGVAIVLMVTSCGGSGSSAYGDATPGAPSQPAASASTTSSAPTTPASSSAVGAAVNVSAKEFSLTVSPTSLSPGPTTFTITNDGTAVHDIVVDGPGVTQVASGMVSPGATATIQVTLTSGTYDIYCNVPGHKSQGMDATVTVT